MIPVVLGILIALLISNWQENKKDRQFVQHVLSAIQTESVENIRQIEKLVPRQQTFLDSIDYHINEESLSLMELLNYAGGIAGPSIKNTAWNAFLNPNIQVVDFKIVSILTDIDSGKKHLEGQFKELSSLIYGRLDSESYGDKIALRSLISEIILTEKQLLEDHLAFMEKSGKPYSSSSNTKENQ